MEEHWKSWQITFTHSSFNLGSDMLFWKEGKCGNCANILPSTGPPGEVKVDNVSDPKVKRNSYLTNMKSELEKLKFSGKQDFSGLSGQFLDCPDNFWIVRTVSGLSGQFLDCPDSF